MMTECKHKFIRQRGSALALVAVFMVILMVLGAGMLTVAYGVRLNAIRIANRTTAMLAAEAGYEKAVFWLSQQPDVAYVMKSGGTYSSSLDFTNSSCDYDVSFFSYLGSRPAYKITSAGHCGTFDKTVEVILLQQIGGWDMGMCQVPDGTTSTQPVYFASGEVIDLPLHINKLNDSPDEKDIYITGNPQFLQGVSVSESRYTGGGSDKYAGVMSLFKEGIDFDQPNSKITDESAVQTKVDRFKDSTKPGARFTPTATAPITNPLAATQIEFGVVNGVGKARVTNNCTVRGFHQSSSSRTWDYKVRPGSNGERYDMYDIYSYHVIPSGEPRPIYNVSDCYVTQSIAGIESEPGGQIFVNGNVIIGGDMALHNGNQVVKGKITIVATGNIWIADSIVLDGPHDADGRPSEDNPNALGLIAQGVIKVVDPGMSDYSYVDNQPVTPSGYTYVPIGIPDSGQPASSYKRHLPNQLEIEAAMTVGGGGFGAENVQRGSYGNRKEASGNQDDLVVRGAITEAIRGVVGLVGSDGYVKKYYFDPRLLKGILPGDIWLRGKYTPAPAGWKDY
jgi:hypothetical protein